MPKGKYTGRTFQAEFDSRTRIFTLGDVSDKLDQYGHRKYHMIFLDSCDPTENQISEAMLEEFIWESQEEPEHCSFREISPENVDALVVHTV
jgi:hypothetical protein